jgi:hypothetical protein
MKYNNIISLLRLTQSLNEYDFDTKKIKISNKEYWFTPYEPLIRLDDEIYFKERDKYFEDLHLILYGDNDFTNEFKLFRFLVMSKNKKVLLKSNAIIMGEISTRKKSYIFEEPFGRDLVVEIKVPPHLNNIPEYVELIRFQHEKKDRFYKSGAYNLKIKFKDIDFKKTLEMYEKEID